MLHDAVGANIGSGLARLLGDQPDGGRIAELVAATLGKGDVSGAGEETFWALRRTFEVLAAERPLVLMFEDIHWAERTCST